MKKTIIAILLCGVMVLALTGCGEIKNKFKVGEKSDIEIEKNDVTLSIKEGTLKNTGATLVLTNNSDKNFHYGNPYEIEIKENGEWHKINVTLNFTLPAFSLPARGSRESELSWEEGYGKLAKGTYRIIKDIDYEKTEGNFENFSVSAEFTI